MDLDVLLTDGNFKHTYAALRALKDKGLRVGIVFNSRASLSYFSRFVIKRFLIKNNINRSSNAQIIFNYKEEIISILKNNKIKVIMPVGNNSFYCFSKYYDEFSVYSKIVVAKDKIMSIAQNKFRTFLFAQENNIPIPNTDFPPTTQSLLSYAGKLSFPCVIKMTNYFERGVIYCNSKEEYVRNLHKILSLQKQGTPPIIQEYINGKAYGFYALYNNGKCINYFMHERIHEYPITGGASTMAKSFYSEELLIAGKSILDKLIWHGVAMVEFKKDIIDNKYKLIEINPKFWGSLELSYVAGINFPYLVYLTALNKSIPKINYKKDVYFRWVLPHDLLWYRFAGSEKRKEFKALKRSTKIINNIHLDDPLTFLYNLLFLVIMLIKDKRYPHGLVKK